MTVPVHGLPSLLQESLEVAVVPPPLKDSRWHIVEDVVDEDERGALIRLSRCHDISSAEALVGKTLLARVDDLPTGFELHDVDALLGREVIEDESGLRGILEEVMRGPANDVWQVRLTDDVCEKVYLLPVIDDVVLDISPGDAIRVRVPEGLLPESTRMIDSVRDGGIL